MNRLALAYAALVQSYQGYIMPWARIVSKPTITDPHRRDKHYRIRIIYESLRLPLRLLHDETNLITRRKIAEVGTCAIRQVVVCSFCGIKRVVLVVGSEERITVNVSTVLGIRTGCLLKRLKEVKLLGRRLMERIHPYRWRKTGIIPTLGYLLYILWRMD